MRRTTSGLKIFNLKCRGGVGGVSGGGGGQFRQEFLFFSCRSVGDVLQKPLCSNAPPHGSAHDGNTVDPASVLSGARTIGQKCEVRAADVLRHLGGGGGC